MYDLILIAAFGGLCIQLLSLLELNKLEVKDRPDFSDWTYYLPWVINPFFGGVLAYIYIASDFDLSPILSLHIGASAPLILRAMVINIPNNY